MSEQLQQLKSIFHEIFQLDQADLDFGIYRIMRQKRDDVDNYLENQLLNDLRLTAKNEFEDSRESIEKQIKEAKRKAYEAGFDPDESPKAKELEQKLSELQFKENLEDSVLSDLVQFLGRYYKDGDFLSLPRYRKNSYAIEYNGEEVKLHWANADQYYVKTAERFRDYRFRLPDGKAVHFKITAANTETGNNKPEGGKERRFQLLENDFMGEEDGELLIFFRYAADEQKRRQADINAETIKRILEEGKNFIEWRKALSKTAPTEKNKDRSLLEKHLNDYTARNTFDYFIHKDLEGFLRRELDFYIKNEIVMLDDIENEDAPRVELYLSKVKSLRRIGHKLIAFLAQVENFCKKLFLKKKFVISANYCVTLDRVPRDLWSDVLTNKAQIEEWRELYAIDEIKGSLINGKGKLNAEFLEANQNLVIDTRYFSEGWKITLLGSFESLDATTDGLLIKSDNFHALNLIKEKYQESLRCIYIDPPYNTGGDGFIYKDGYKESSWISMILDRVYLASKLLLKNGVLLTSIDDNEVENLLFVLKSIFGQQGVIANFVWKRRVTSSLAQSWISTDHEYVIACSFDVDDVEILGEERNMDKYNIPDKDGKFFASMPLTVGMNRSQRPNQWYELINPSTGTKYLPPPNRVWGFYPPTMQTKIKEGKILFPEDFPNKKMTTPRLKTYPEDAKRDRKPLSTWIAEKKQSNENNDKNFEEPRVLEVGKNEEGTRILKSFFGELELVFPKPVSLVNSLCSQFTFSKDIILDFFAGSATTAHAVINLNREDEGERKYILVETNEYFDSVTLPRVKKVIYSKDWKDGKPVSREGSSHLLKYFALESYEDAMNNLVLNKSEEIEQAGLQFTNEFREDYLLNYMLEFETQGSQSLLNSDSFAAPFDYKMKIAVNGVGETQETPIDLVETFNYLIGLYVEKTQQIDGFRVVHGTTRTGERCLILWRTTKDLKQELADKRLNDFLEKQNFDFSEIDTLYINGDAAIPVGDVRAENAVWQVKMIEAEFLKRMFE